MLIERELIDKAKEKIGDENADLIAELLGIQGYDSQKKRGLCPFHREDTPSFIYNPKKYCFHCFGCGVNSDLIDAYVKSGKTYISAIETIFEKAGIKYSFGEHQVKTMHDYRYPHDEPEGDMTKVYNYLSKRGISKETVDYAGLRQDGNGNIVFRYFDTNDTLTMVKYRPARKVEHGENKMWCQKDADTCPLLFNMNRVSPDSPLAICEGELDSLAAIEAGWQNVVSVPLGAKNTHWIEQNWEWLNQFQTIIMCGDNDEPGQKMIKDVSYRLGSWRTKISVLPTEYEKPDGTKIPIKDLNEVLYWYGKDKALDCIVHAKDSPVESVVDFSDIKEVDLDEIDGLTTGIKEFDREMMRLFYGTFNILTGVNGCVDCNTEYFNGEIWKKISDYSDGEFVYQYTNEHKKGLVKPLEYIKKQAYNFIRISSKNGFVYQVVSPEHEIVLFKNKEIPHKVNALYAILSLLDTNNNLEYILTDKGFEKFDRENIEWEIIDSGNYKYCFTVPSGMLVLRRNGRINITGNSGKSSFLSQLVCQCLEQGRDAWLYSKELPNFMTKNWTNYILAGGHNITEYESNIGSVYYKVNPEAKQKIDEFYKGRFYIYKDGWSNTVDDIMKSMEDSARKFGSKLFIIDNLTAINLGAGGDEKWNKQVDLVNFLIDFAKKYNVVVLLVNKMATCNSNVA